MSEMIFVRPREGGRIRQPERGYTVMPDTGAFVPRDTHYEKLLATGDVVRADPPTKATPEAEAAAPATEAPAPETAAAAEAAEEPSTQSRKSRGR